MHAAAMTISEVVRSGILPRTVEYMDQSAIRCVEDYLQIGLPIDAGAMLLIDIDGSAPAVEETLQRLVAICEEGGANEIKVATSELEAKDLWKARQAISPALFQLGPDKINQDIVVPRSRIPEMVEWIDDLRRRTGLTIVTFGHAGDGNIHFNIMLDRSDKETLEKAESAVREVFQQTIALGGTISGEHGVGVSKAPYIGMEIGGEELALMKRIKEMFDPNGVLNPGKIFQEDEGVSPT